MNFLRDRSFVVKVGDFSSESIDMPAGTPQGSVCSPLLFNVFMHDIPTDEFIKTLQFADDTTLYATDNDPGRIQCHLNRHLVGLMRYFNEWRLAINADKSGLCVFTGFVRETGVRIRRHFRRLAISINGHLLKRSNTMKLLGVTF